MPETITRQQVNAVRKADAGDRSAYDALPGVNQSRLRPFLSSTCHGAYALANPMKQTEAMRLGIMAHALALEGWKAYHDRFVVTPESAPKKPTKAQMTAKKPSEDAVAAIAWWKDFEAVHAGKEIIDRETDEQVVQVAERIQLALQLYEIDAIGKEVALTAQYGEVTLKGCLDIVTSDGFIYDVKTTGLEATREDWGRTLERDVGLALQMAFYSYLFRENFGFSPHGFRHLVVETSPPYGFRVFQASVEIAAKGTEAMIVVLDRWKEYVAAGAPTDLSDLPLPYPVEVVEVAPWKPSASSSQPIPFA